MKKNTILISAAVAFGLFFVFLVAMREYEKQLAQKNEIASIRTSMPHKDVVDILGVLYDGHPIGEYEDIDKIARTMDEENRIKYVYYWRLSGSKETFWIGFDSERRVVSTLLQQK